MTEDEVEVTITLPKWIVEALDASNVAGGRSAQISRMLRHWLEDRDNGLIPDPYADTPLRPGLNKPTEDAADV